MVEVKAKTVWGIQPFTFTTTIAGFIIILKNMIRGNIIKGIKSKAVIKNKYICRGSFFVEKRLRRKSRC